MSWGRALQLAAILLVASLLSGCSSYFHYQIKRALALEAKGHTEKALEIYAGVAHQARDRQLRSLAYYHLGECLWRMDRSAESLAAFQRATEEDNSNTAAHLRLGQMYLVAGAAERAKEQAHAILQVASRSVEGLALLGAASSAVGNTSLAETAYSRVLQSDPTRVNIAIALANIYNGRDDVNAARAVLQRAAASQPASALPWLALGRLEEQEGEPAAAESSYRRAVATEDTAETNERLAQFLQRTARIAEAEAVLHRVDSLRPGFPVAVSDFWLLSGDAKNALDRYTTALRSPLLEQRESTNSRLWGVLKVSPNGYAKIVMLQRASLAARIVESDLQLAGSDQNGDSSGIPNTSVARLHLGEYQSELDPATICMLQAEIALAEKDLTAASRYAEGAVKLAPDSASAHYIRGMVEYLAGNANEARRSWLDALDRDGDYAPARLALAEQALASGDARGAEQHVVAVVREEPGNARAVNLFARVLIAEKRYSAAALIARRGAILAPNLAEPHVLLGSIAVARDEPGTALAEYNQAVSIEPRSEAAMDGLTRIYKQGKITRPMLIEVERAAETPPTSAVLMEIAGRVYAENGWLEDARRCLRRALSMDPKRTTAARVLARLESFHGGYATALKSGAKAGGAEAALLSGTEAETRRDFTTAIREYGVAVQQGERSGIAANNLAWLLSTRSGSLDRALEMANKAASLAPDNPSVLDTLGYVWLKRREYSKSIAVLKQAVNLATAKEIPADEARAIRGHLAEAYFRAGENDQAETVLAVMPKTSVATGH